MNNYDRQTSTIIVKHHQSSPIDHQSSSTTTMNNHQQPSTTINNHHPHYRSLPLTTDHASFGGKPPISPVPHGLLRLLRAGRRLLRLRVLVLLRCRALLGPGHGSGSAQAWWLPGLSRHVPSTKLLPWWLAMFAWFMGGFLVLKWR